MTLVALITSATAADASPKRTASDVFVGYVHGRAAEIDYGLYTHLCHAFVVPDPSGAVRPRPAVPDAEFAAEAHRHGVKVLLSVGGWGHDARFAKIAGSPEAEDRQVESLLRMVEEFGYDGVDLDWEYPDSEVEMPGFGRLARRLRAGLDALGDKRGAPMLLTMAASASPDTLSWLSDGLLVRTMDWVNVMTYDYAGGWTTFAGHNAPFDPSPRAPETDRQSVTKTFDYLLQQRGLPPDRLVLGLPLYGRAFSVAEPYASTAGTENAGQSKTFAESQRLLTEGWSRSWDEATKTPWLLSPSRNAVLGFDDAVSIQIKTRWARDKDLRGIFFWEVSQDRTAVGGNVLQRAAKEAWGPLGGIQTPD